MDWLDWALWAIAAAWVVVVANELRRLGAVRILPPLASPSPPAPRVSVIVPARDEAAHIEGTVRGLLRQRHVDIEVIVADDRSSDATGAITDGIAREDGRVRRVRVDALPEGWLGKCHACHRAAEGARGEWLLFTDADIRMDDDVIARAAAEGERAGAAQVALSPVPRTSTFWSRAAMTFLNKMLLMIGAASNLGRPNAYIGIGAFNLIRADAYRAAGGHGPLRLEIVDDMKIGLLIRRAGLRTLCMFGGGAVRADWGASLGQIVRLLEKNHFAALGYSVSRAVGALALFVVFWMGAALAPLTLRPAGFAAFGGLLLTIVPAYLIGRRTGGTLAEAMVSPITMPVLIWSMARSACLTLRRGGVRWRETFYPLAILREHHRALHARDIRAPRASAAPVPEPISP